MINKKYGLSVSILTIAIICGSFTLPATSATKKKKKSTVTTACIACLNAFDAESLQFTIDPDKCPKRIAKCYKANQTNKCEGIIEECIQYNCKTAGSCGDEVGNRNLFAGCLKAVNQVLPYQCASYIAGYASSKAEEVKALQTAQENAIKQKEIDAKNAAAAAEKAKAAAEEKAAKLAADAETKKAQIAADNEIKLAQEKAKLEQQARDAEITRQKKEAQEARNNKPNVKYNNLLNDVKQSITSAKNYTTKAYNLLGITKTDDKQSNGSAIFFPPQIIEVPGIMASTDAKTRSLVNSSRYKSEQRFVCTRDTKENFIKNELNNVYNTIKKSRDNLANGIADIEAVNADDETTDSISETKINTLYLAQNKLTEIMETVEGYTANLKTSCETRCAGLSSFNPATTMASSSKIEFDENGNIIEEKKKEDNTAYSCKDLDKDTTAQTGFPAFFTGSNSGMSDMVGGIGKKVAELTKRNTEAVLFTDKLLDETLIAVQSGKFDDSMTDYPAIDSCVQYMVLDIASYTNCISNVLGQQLTTLSNNKSNQSVIKELNSSINTVLKTIQSPNYKDKLANTSVYCNGNSTSSGQSLFNKDNTITPITASLHDFNDFNTCILSITNALNEAKKEKNETGKSNFYITNVGNDYIYVDGQGLDATSFAKNKLGWSAAKYCNISIANRTTEYDRMSGAVYSQSSIDIDNSVLSCECSNDGKSACRILDINMGRCRNICGGEK